MGPRIGGHPLYAFTRITKAMELVAAKPRYEKFKGQG
jgi:hypothetical protein